MLNGVKLLYERRARLFAPLRVTYEGGVMLEIAIMIEGQNRVGAASQREGG